MVKKKPRTLTKTTRQTGTSNLKRDLKFKALAPGKRISKEGNIYYEYRKNRSDVKGIDTPKKKPVKQRTPKTNSKIKSVLRKSVIIGVDPTKRKMMIQDVTPSRVQSKEVAMTILSQLGGRKFIAMTGARQFVNGNNWMAFKIPRGINGIRRIKITLNLRDLYDLEFMTLSGKLVKKLNGVYFDELQELFTIYTGLNTRL